MLAMIAVIALCIGWPTSPIQEHQRRVRSQQQTVVQLQAMGATVEYDFYDVKGGVAPGPKWLRMSMGVDRFSEAIGVYIASPPAVGSVHFQNGLQMSSTTHKPVTDSDLRVLGGLTRIRKLHLANVRITGCGLQHLRRLRSLEQLAILQMPITDADLVHLHELTNLKSVFFSNTQVTPAGVKTLREKLPNCLIQVMPEPMDMFDDDSGSPWHGFKISAATQ
jgi:hypothetical protein